MEWERTLIFCNAALPLSGGRGFLSRGWGEAVPKIISTFVLRKEKRNDETTGYF